MDKNISFCSLKCGNDKNEDCSLTYPNIQEKRKQIDVVSGLRAINSIKMPKKNLAGSVIDRSKSTCRKRDQSYDIFVVVCKETLEMAST